MINILIVDDSLTEATLLKKIFATVPDMQVIGCARNGKESIQLAKQYKPDVITMDIDMPVMDGLEATKIIMSQTPTPIVVISAKTKTTEDDTNMVFKALEAGALSVLSKPFAVATADQEYQAIIDTVRAMAEIKVVKRRFAVGHRAQRVRPQAVMHGKAAYEIVAIGTSVGGPQALKDIITRLPADFNLPIVIVQHIAQGFIGGFVKWLNDISPLPVKIAEHLEILQKGVIYFAPENYHLTVARLHKNLIAKLTESPPVSGFCPSVTVLFQSIAHTCGPASIGVLLTGMGNDGAAGLLDIKHAHGHTFIQDPESAVVFGMAGVAQSLNAVDKVVPLVTIADYLVALTKH